MAIEALAASLVTALATKAFEKTGEKVGEKSGETVLSLVKGLFTHEELITLNLSAEALQDPKAQGRLEAKLEDRLPAHPDIAEQLEAWLKQLPEAEGAINIMKQTGNDNIGMQNIQGSEINIKR
jgi:hypothetical protein